MQVNDFLWWHHAIIYQVYPRSFQDSNADGIGDLRGVVQRLDYLKWLGIEAIWLSPIFPSPMADFGYDVADYTDIHPIFGTMADFDHLLSEAHQRGIKVLLDLVPNHSSSEHPWFKESRSSKDNPKRDWYIWKDALEDGAVPNNWLSVFGGSAWEWDELTGQYYYHGFLKEQPDLNWRNEEVVSAMLNVMRFWLDRGVDGFRVDVLWHIFKDEKLRDNPPNPNFSPTMPSYDSLLPVFSTDQPEVHDVVKRMRQLVDKYVERVIIGEIYLPYESLMIYYGTDNDGIHLPFNFTLIAIPWDPQIIALAINSYESVLPKVAWPNWVLSNHDRPRIASRIGEPQARVAAMLLLTLRGTPTLYYGDEIGMKDVEIPFSEMQDPQGLNMPDLNMSRDPARTPMQWNAEEYAGFTTTNPWLRISDNYTSQNVEAQLKDSSSTLSLYKQLIALRQSEPSLLYGAYDQIYADHQLLAYTRKFEGYDGFLIVLNFSNESTTFNTSPELEGTIVISNSGFPYKWKQGLSALAPDEGLVIRLNSGK
jgi:alpha-glucosidase